jgi:hypothetical protein
MEIRKNDFKVSRSGKKFIKKEESINLIKKQIN